MESKHAVMTYFYISGVFDPEEITQLLGLEPTDYWSVGDINDEAYWAFGENDKYDPYVFNMVKQSIAPLLDKKDILKEIHDKYQVRMFIEIVATMDKEEVLPCFSPDLGI